MGTSSAVKVKSPPGHWGYREDSSSVQEERREPLNLLQSGDGVRVLQALGERLGGEVHKQDSGEIRGSGGCCWR